MLELPGTINAPQRRLARAAAALLLLFSAALLSACTGIRPYRTEVPAANAAVAPCHADDPGDLGNAGDKNHPRCVHQATEVHPRGLYTMHVVEFDDQGWPFDALTGGHSQIDSAIGQIRQLLVDKADFNCVRLYVYVHGWRHNAAAGDDNVQSFRRFLRQVAEGTASAAAAGKEVCQTPTPVEQAAPASERQAGARLTSKPDPRAAERIKTVGLYVGWRGMSLQEFGPLALASFWDRKNTAERVAQGSVRELFARLKTLALYAPANGKPESANNATRAQLRTYVIGHSFGASVVFRALSQSLIDSFSEDLDSDGDESLASVSRFADMVVLVNPAIEAARFDPLFRAAEKRAGMCTRKQTLAQVCARPLYQSPVLAIFTSEGDAATHRAFPLGSSLSHLFEPPIDQQQQQAMQFTIGWDDSYRTHMLEVSSECHPDDAQPYTRLDNDPPRYKIPGWRWCFEPKTGTRVTLTHLSLPAEDQVEPTSSNPESEAMAGPRLPPGNPRVPYNGPLWNLQVSQQIIADHNDIWNPLFHDLLLYLFTGTQGANQRDGPGRE